MTVHDLSPFYMEIFSHSADAPHVMTLPLIGWTAGAGAGDIEQVNGSSTPAQAAVEAFCTLLEPFFPSTYAWDYYFIYAKPTPTSDSTVVAGGTLSNVGSAAVPGWSRATQATFTFKTLAGNLLKIVLLDNATGNNFAPINFATLTGDAAAFVNFLLSTSSWVVGRDGSRAAFFLKIAYKLNDELRKQYHLD